MRWSFEIARVAGIRVRVHFTFLLLLAWLGAGYYRVGGSGAAIGGVFFMLLLFGCVLLHEFRHAIAAKAFGIRTPDITLLPIGGVARMERMPERPAQELIVALAGPAVNVMIVLGILSVAGAQNLFDSDALTNDNLLARLFTINLVLILFNMLPAFPMDGGRVLRALLALRLPHVRATRIAAKIGRACAVLFGLVGLFFSHPMLLLIAVFIYSGATQELRAAELKFSESEVFVGEARPVS